MDTSSPYFTGASPNFGPPGGLAGLISQGRDQRIDLSGVQQFADVAQKFKQQQDLGKSADYFVKAQPDALAALGIHPEEWKTLSAGDKSAAVGGLLKSQASASAMQQMADVAAQARERDAQAQSLQDTGSFLKSFAEPLPSGTEDTPENRLRNALAKMPPGASIGRVFPQAMSALEKFAAVGANNNPNFVADTNSVPGWSLTGMKGSKQWQALPTGGANVQMVDDGNGNQMPVLISPKGGATALKNGTALAPKDALATYNKNQTRIAQLAAQLKMADDPQYSAIMDKEALGAELQDLQSQQATLKPVWQKTQPATAAGNSPAAKPGLAAPGAKNQALIQQAQDAIAKGAPKAAVAARLKQQYGIDLP